MGRLADDIYENLGPFAAEDLTGELGDFVQALLDPVEDLAAVLTETDEHLPWELALDVDQVPEAVLPWLAQWVGVRLGEDDSIAQRRERIRTPDGFARGTPAALIASAKRTLTGTARVVVRERTPDAYNLYVRTITAETPDVEATRAALLAQKPAGLTLDYDAVAAMSYIDLDADYEDYDAVDAAFESYDELGDTPP